MKEQAKEVERIPDAVLEEVAECLKVMGHPVRLRLVNLLGQGRFAVHELAERTGVSANQVCEHLRLLQHYGLLASEREGRTVYYVIRSPRLVRLMGCISVHCEVDKEL